MRSEYALRQMNAVSAVVNSDFKGIIGFPCINNYADQMIQEHIHLQVQWESTVQEHHEQITHTHKKNTAKH